MTSNAQPREYDLDNGLHMRCYEAGDGPRTVLFLHGFPELAHSWHNQLAVVPPGYRFVAPDMRGYGGTDAPKHRWDYTMPKLVGDITALVRALGVDKVDLVGHDWGGAVAWEVARREGRLLRSLTVMNCPPGDMMVREMRTNLKQLRKSWYMFFFQLPIIPELVLHGDPDHRVPRNFKAMAKNRAVFTQEAMAPYVEQVKMRGLPGVNYYRGSIAALFDRARPPLIKAPTRLIWGVDDPALGIWFAEESRYRRVAEQFDVVRIENSGHWVQQEQPELVNRALLEHLARH